MTDELSIADKQRILEYQRTLRRQDALRRHGAAIVEAAEDALRARGLDPGLARHVTISHTMGDR